MFPRRVRERWRTDGRLASRSLDGLLAPEDFHPGVRVLDVGCGEMVRVLRPGGLLYCRVEGLFHDLDGLVHERSVRAFLCRVRDLGFGLVNAATGLQPTPQGRKAKAEHAVTRLAPRARLAYPERLVSKGAVVLRNTLWTSLDQVVAFVLPTAASILVARELGPAKLGHYNYVVWIAQMTAVLGTFGVPEAARVFLAARFGRREPGEALAILRWMLKFQLAIALVCVVAGVALTFILAVPENRLYTILAVLSVLPGALMGLATAVNAAAEDFGANVLPSIAGVVVQTAGILATLLWNWELTGLAASLLAGRTVDSALRFAMIARRLPRYLQTLAGGPLREPEPLSPAVRSDLLAFCWRSTGLLLVNLVVWSRSEVLFLERFCDIRQLAFFSVAFSFAVLPARLAEPLSWAAGAGLLKEHGRDPVAARRFAVTFLRYLALIVLPAALGLSALAGPLIRTVYGVAYAPAAPVLALGAALSFLPSLAPPFQNLVIAAGGQRQVLRVNLTAAALTLALDFWLVWSHCALGGALANGVGQGLATVGLLAVARSQFGFEVPWSFLGRLAAIAVATGASALALTAVAPDLVAVVLGPPVGLLVYLGLLRAFRVLDSEDRQRLNGIAASLPRPLRALLGRLLGWLGEG